MKKVKKTLSHNKFVMAVATLLVGSMLSFGMVVGVQAYSDSTLMNKAKVYATSGEQVVTPTIINYNRKDYYYVPFEYNNSISSALPGFMLDRSGNPVSDKGTLKELFRYPGPAARPA